MPEPLDLDHVAIVVRDLDIAERNFRRLGFNLTPRSSHKGPVPPDGNVELWGTGNHCAMFEQGYLELLGITDPDRHKVHVEKRLEKYEGLQLIAFGTGDAAASVAEIRGRGGAIADPAKIGRDVPFGSGTKPGWFGIANLDGEVLPEADFIVIEQMTRDVLWQPDLLPQANGVVSLEAITICSDDPDDLKQRLTPVLGSPAGDGFDLAEGRVEILSEAETHARYGGHPLVATPPVVVAVTLGVADLGETAAYLHANEVPIDAPDLQRLRVGADIGCGAIVEFAATTFKGAGR